MRLLAAERRVCGKRAQSWVRQHTGAFMERNSTEMVADLAFMAGWEAGRRYGERLTAATSASEPA